MPGLQLPPEHDGEHGPVRLHGPDGRLQHLGGGEEVLPPLPHGAVELPWLPRQTDGLLPELELLDGDDHGHARLPVPDGQLQHLDGADKLLPPLFHDTGHLEHLQIPTCE